MKSFLWFFVCTSLTAAPAFRAPPPKPRFEQVADGIIVPVKEGFLKLEVYGDAIVRVACSTNRGFFYQNSLATETKRSESVRWKVTETFAEIVLVTPKLQVKVDLASGGVRFLDAAGNRILTETERTIEPAVVQGEATFHVRQEWKPNEGEALYGLGQHQLGLMNIKGYDLDLWQHNATVVVPFLVSSRGYGILWDNLSWSRFGDLRPYVPIPTNLLFDAEGKPGGLTGSYYRGPKFDQLVAKRLDAKLDIEVAGSEKEPNKFIHPELPPTGDVSVRWEGEVLAKETGDHIFQIYSCSGIKLWVDDRLVINHWRQGWLPWYDVARVKFAAGSRHKVKLEWNKDQGMETVRLLWKAPWHEADEVEAFLREHPEVDKNGLLDFWPPPKSTSLWSEVGEGTGYYFIYGPELDRVIAGYRQLTGAAPMMPRWAYGFWQCRERYKTAQEVLDVLDGFRSRGIPLDNIVQDWQYWRLDSWGSHQFDPSRYPDPAGWIRAIHDQYHARLMISVWGKFYPGNVNFDAMQKAGFLYQGTHSRGIKDWLGFNYAFYDAFNPRAGQLFWSQINRDLFSKGVDAWWMDATEPDLEQPMPTREGQKALTHPSNFGTGARVFNGYALANSKTIYEGQRTVSPDQRVFILTRSGFAGQQRYAAAVWSGDVTATWTALKQQIPAGFSFALSGMPYWTTDIGGFAVPPRWAGTNATSEDLEEWRELNTRWFQFGTFCPLFRAHGQFPFREMWNIAPEAHPAYQTQLKFDRLRYRLLPYIYSLAGAVTQRGATIMRPLIMDFPYDPNVREIGDQFMFGPSLLVNPVTDYQARRRVLYLPAIAGGWYDFWTGAALAGGQWIEAPAPYDSMPLFVPAGSIIPTGPELQYTGEKPADPITLHVYAGADGAFSLYEDDGLTYGYERGESTRIPFRLDDKTRTLTLEKREGTFPGMLAERIFNVVLISPGRSAGFSFDPKLDQTLRYSGRVVKARLEPTGVR